MLPKEIFADRFAENNTKKNEFKALGDRWINLRGLAFVIGIIATYFAAKIFGNGAAFLAFGIFVAIFLLVVSKHNSIKLQMEKFAVRALVNQNELNRLNHNFAGLPTGQVFAEANHFYLSDLDLFGNSSLFQLLNRTHTLAGGQMLANWMKYPAPKSTIEERQQATGELAKKLDFRQQFETEAMLSDKVGQPTQNLLQWIETPENEKIKKPFFNIAQYLPIITTLVLIGAILGFYTFYFVALLFVIQGVILKQIDKDVSEALEQTEIAGATLKPYSALLGLIKNENFENNYLTSLKNKINNAPKSVDELEQIIHNLNYRTNPAFAVTGGIFMMWDLKYFLKLEAWKTKYKHELPNWLDIVSQVEAQNSLAGFQFANPDFTTPKISENDIFLESKAIGHPMIKPEKRVNNDISLVGLGKTHIITGSNMSGKSTFQRTLGVNLVLAMMGGVVCAKSFECSIMQLFTSMRTQDSLEEDTSSFYAELKRLELLIQLTKLDGKAKSTLPTIYFLDEILKGTNSKDRHLGAKALMLQLNKANASGFISTHDVELGDEFEGTDFIKNYSFSSEVGPNGLVFDYTLRNGVCHSFNASELMRRIGIEV